MYIYFPFTLSDLVTATFAIYLTTTTFAHHLTIVSVVEIKVFHDKNFITIIIIMDIVDWEWGVRDWPANFFMLAL